jgi:hypothetical protein
MQDKDVDELQRIWDLKEKGAISEEEYVRLKSRILDQPKGTASEDAPGPALKPGQVARTNQPVADKERPERPGYGKIAGIGCAVLLGLFVLAGVIGSTTSQNSSTPVNASDGAVDTNAALVDSNASDTSKPPPEEDTPSWSYSQDEDKVRGGTTYYARTTSTNSIAQSFPYDSDTTMSLAVRKSPAYGTDVILTISSGQMMCPSYEGCGGTVRFDNGPAQHVSFNGPADNSSDTVFVEGAKAFIAKLRKAKKVTIEKTLYEAGSPQFEFDVHGLKWDH